MESVCRAIIKEIIKKKASSIDKVSAIRRELCRKYSPKEFPSFIRILSHARGNELNKLSFLVTKPSRTISGVAPVAIMTKPMECPHGKCIMCPGGISSHFGTVPQSYTGHEPASMRARRNLYDPYLQTMNRLEQYTLLNQCADKVELIIMGGTFPSFPLPYQNSFVKYSLKAMNDFSKMFFKGSLDIKSFKEFFELPGDVNDELRTNNLKEKMSKIKGNCSLIEEQRKNEKSRIRCVAMAIETRPDFSKQQHISQMLRLGCTRVELGVQSTCNSVLKRIARGHSTEDTIEATQLLKDSFLKVGYHMMPGLPSSTKEKDIKMFKELFSNESYRPDALKIYPCMVIEGTKLYELYKKKKFNPITTQEAQQIITEAKKYIPEYCRIMRVQRDIPTKVTAAGVSVTNLRQMVGKCRCIRCREPRGKEVSLEDSRLRSLHYKSSGGDEVFLSIESKDVLLGFCRLRIPYKPFRKEITDRSVGIRELHVYSPSIALKTKSSSSIQHQGLGKRLLMEAEKTALEEFDCKKMLVISGIGAKEYYRKLGYKDDGAYVSKSLT
ncbi:MAG: tRNA uridine(34) 5-carboxymethylaminomethyl modification radical SAM/GNAT enzyme Elp3 [Candidatus Woesearchaeota archaeon]